MLFNSLHFLIFFPIVVGLYFGLPARYRRVLLLLASYYFYMAWRAEYIVFILGSTVVDYYVGLRLGAATQPQARRRWLWLSLVLNLGLLFTFKYANFFADIFNGLTTVIRLPISLPALNLILPVGISFYTFQSLSYIFDVYRGTQAPERNLLTYAMYVAFFPQLVAGPIERPGHMLPQFSAEHRFNSQQAGAGLQRMLWGFFMKVVIADRAAMLALPVFNNPQGHSGWELLLACYLLTFMVYCDFDGYSEIALGAAQVIGFRLMENFKRPYLSPSVVEFWRRWHISLISWFTDYVYIPLGGSRRGAARWTFNIMVVFLLSGLWHGANWTYVLWGGMNGLFIVVAVTLERSGIMARLQQSLGLDRHPRARQVLGILITYHLFILSGIFFMAPSLDNALYILTHFWRGGATQFLTPVWLRDALPLCGWIVLLMIVESLREFRPARLEQQPTVVRRAWQYALIVIILMFGVFDNRAFVYYQF